MHGGDRKQTKPHDLQRDFMFSVQTTCDMVCDGRRDSMNLLTIGGLNENMNM